MMMKYLKYELKKSVWPIIILTIIGSLIYISSLMASNFAPQSGDYVPGSKIGIISFILCSLCTLVPIYELSYLKKKRSIDEFYSLPIKRATFITCKFISGYVKILLSYSIIFFLGLLVVIGKDNAFYFKFYFSFFIYSLLVGICLYAFYSFIFSRANTIIDGIIFMFFYTFTLSLIGLCINQFSIEVFGNKVFPNLDNYYPYSPIINLTEYYDMLIRYGRAIYIDLFHWVALILWSIIGILSIFGLIYSTKIDKAERAEQLSNSYFGYRVLIPLYMILIIYGAQLKLFDTFYLIIQALLFGAGLVAYIIYRRNFKLHIRYWIIVFSSIVLGHILVILF